MQLMNVIYVSDMPTSVAFYQALGLQLREPGQPDEYWNQFMLGEAALALHLDDALEPTSQRVEIYLVLEADGSLDRLFANAQEQQLETDEEIKQEDFGRVFWVRDPDGQTIFLMETRGA